MSYTYYKDNNPGDKYQPYHSLLLGRRIHLHHSSYNQWMHMDRNQLYTLLDFLYRYRATVMAVAMTLVVGVIAGMYVIHLRRRTKATEKRERTIHSTESRY